MVQTACAKTTDKQVGKPSVGAPVNVASASFTRGGSDQILYASLPDIGSVTPTYDVTYGYVTNLLGDVQSDLGYAYSLRYGHDPYTGKLLTQALLQTSEAGTTSTLLDAANSYDALGRRIQRTVDGGQLSSASVSTDYWYGPMQGKPLFVARSTTSGGSAASAQTGRVIFLGEEVLAIESGVDGAVTDYPMSDHLGSVRAVLDGGGETQASLSYGEWGQTAISGKSATVDVMGLNTLFRFQGIEQETFPLTTLDVGDAEAQAWLDGIAQYHYYGREYAAGLASFLEMDPADASVSPYTAYAANPANFNDPDGMAAKLARDSFEAFVAHMRNAGIQKVFISELHNSDGRQPYNLDAAARTMVGMTQVGPTKFWREIKFRDENSLAGAMQQFNGFPKLPNSQKEELALMMAAQIMSDQSYPPKTKKLPEYKLFKDSLLTQGAGIAPLVFAFPSRNGLPQFIQSPGAAVAQMGAAHAEYAYLKAGNAIVAPWSGTALPVADEYRHLKSPKMEEIWGGWARAVAHNATNVMMLRASTIYKLKPAEGGGERSKLLDYYRREGFAVLEYPVIAGKNGYNMTVIAPAAMTSNLLDFIKTMEHPETVNFDCTGLPGCAGEKTEL